jgi:hypothetical protein
LFKKYAEGTEPLDTLSVEEFELLMSDHQLVDNKLARRVILAAFGQVQHDDADIPATHEMVFPEFMELFARLADLRYAHTARPLRTKLLKLCHALWPHGRGRGDDATDGSLRPGSGDPDELTERESGQPSADRPSRGGSAGRDRENRRRSGRNTGTLSELAQMTGPGAATAIQAAKRAEKKRAREEREVAFATGERGGTSGSLANGSVSDDEGIVKSRVRGANRRSGTRSGVSSASSNISTSPIPPSISTGSSIVPVASSSPPSTSGAIDERRSSRWNPNSLGMLTLATRASFARTRGDRSVNMAATTGALILSSSGSISSLSNNRRHSKENHNKDGAIAGHLLPGSPPMSPVFVAGGGVANAFPVLPDLTSSTTSLASSTAHPLASSTIGTSITTTASASASATATTTTTTTLGGRSGGGTETPKMSLRFSFDGPSTPLVASTSDTDSSPPPAALPSTLSSVSSTLASSVSTSLSTSISTSTSSNGIAPLSPAHLGRIITQFGLSSTLAATTTTSSSSLSSSTLSSTSSNTSSSHIRNESGGRPTSPRRSPSWGSTPALLSVATSPPAVAATIVGSGTTTPGILPPSTSPRAVSKSVKFNFTSAPISPTASAPKFTFNQTSPSASSGTSGSVTAGHIRQRSSMSNELAPTSNSTLSTTTTGGAASLHTRAPSTASSTWSRSGSSFTLNSPPSTTSSASTMTTTATVNATNGSTSTNGGTHSRQASRDASTVATAGHGRTASAALVAALEAATIVSSSSSSSSSSHVRTSSPHHHRSSSRSGSRPASSTGTRPRSSSPDTAAAGLPRPLSRGKSMSKITIVSLANSSSSPPIF